MDLAIIHTVKVNRLGRFVLNGSLPFLLLYFGFDQCQAPQQYVRHRRVQRFGAFAKALCFRYRYSRTHYYRFWIGCGTRHLHSLL